MQQSSVTDYFKTKKRVRGSGDNLKGAKVLAFSSNSPEIKEIPNKPIRTFNTDESSSSCLVRIQQTAEPSEIRAHIDRKTVKGVRRVPAPTPPCFQRFHHLISKSCIQGNTPQTISDITAPVRFEPISSLVSGTGPSVSTNPINTNLPLPFKYHNVLELFRALDTISSILFNRNETITFKKAQASVRELYRTTQIQEKHLAQFLTVLPNCYSFTWEKLRMPMSREASYELIIKPNFNLHHNSGEYSTQKMSAAVLTERRTMFETRLTEICYNYHKDFLTGFKPPIMIPEDKKLTRWHPKFKINEVPDIPLAEISKSPSDGCSSISSAREVLLRAQTLMDSANPRTKKALQDLLLKSTTPKEDDSSKPSSPKIGTVPPVFPKSASTESTKPSSTPQSRELAMNAILQAQQILMQKAKDNPKMREAVNKILLKKNQTPISDFVAPENVLSSTGVLSSNISTASNVNKKGNHLSSKSLAALKGVSQSLIDKIRARENEKSIRSMTLTPEQTKRRAVLNRLPEFVKIVRNMMVAEKKTALALNTVAERLRHSHYQSLTQHEIDAHVRCLQEIVPEWISIVKSTQGEYVKIENDVNINGIIQKIEGIIKGINK